MSELVEETEVVSAAPVSAPVSTPEEEVEKYDFDEEFQTKIAALVLRDGRFLRQVRHLIRPEYFEAIGDAAMVKLGLDFYDKYETPLVDRRSAIEFVRDGLLSKTLRAADKPAMIDAIRRLYDPTLDLSAPDYVVDKTVAFARSQAMTKALIEGVDLLKSKDMSQIQRSVQAALNVGPNKDEEGYDFFVKAAARADKRIDKASGKTPYRGITTGHVELDDLLYHHGWGRKELATLLGGAKAGKTTALLGFALAASLAGHNVLYASLEVGAEIISDRLDASASGTPIKSLSSAILDIKSKVEALGKKAGRFMIHEYASGTLKPSALEALLERYEANGVKFDLVVVDYADIMAPNRRVDDVIENSKTIYVDLRAIAFKFDLAMLTATQTNREGFKSTVAKAEHVSEDFNKVRTVDIMISISATEEERARGEARLYFAASRNTESGFSLRVKTDIGRMRFIEKILGRE